ncbi:hypothetical protein Ancab_021017 [Ancistrocladus abbreviatus]
MGKALSHRYSCGLCLSILLNFSSLATAIGVAFVGENISPFFLWRLRTWSFKHQIGFGGLLSNGYLTNFKFFAGGQVWHNGEDQGMK